MIKPAIDWTTIKSAILRWFKESTGLSCVIWSDQKGAQPPYPYGNLSILSQVSVGHAEPRYEFDSVNNRFNVCVGAQENFAVSCQIRYGATENCDPGRDAINLMGFAKACLQKPSVKEYLREANVAIANENTPINNIDLVVADLWVKAAQWDVTFRTASNIVETDENWFEKVGISSDINPPVPASVELDDEEFGG